MAWDDPVVWILIVAVVIFLFGANKIPGLAKSIGQARREFDKGWKGIDEALTSGSPSTSTNAQPVLTNQTAPEDPLVSAARREGIETQGKTREQIASELSWKLNKK